MSDYDVYHLWLGIPPEEQPPSYYRLLGVRLFEENAEVIRNAADRQRSHVKRLGVNQFEEIGQELLNEIEVAKICLLKPEKRAAYDERLKGDLLRRESAGQTLVGEIPPDSDGHSDSPQQESLIIGSDPNCDIVINLRVISGIHCSVMRRNKYVLLRDLKSTNGTFVNLMRVTQPTKIVPSDLIVLGRDARLKLPSSFFPPVQKLARVGFVGRSEQCEFPIRNDTVSAYHAKFIVDSKMVQIEDLGSTNGTYLVDATGKSNRVPPRKLISIGGFASIVFGKHQITTTNFKAQIEKLDLTWSDGPLASDENQ